ncbi:hypothetical protein SAMN05444147_109191 [Pectobacterium carotovorum]|nr:hypothetical protein PEC301619_41940 [Pectobacterium carotovorum subsp. carotovorum]SHH41449.1 hypothetical protein SAMN05444147_109191 [Pectobacterium carotovorum]
MDFAGLAPGYVKLVQWGFYTGLVHSHHKWVDPKFD